MDIPAASTQTPVSTFAYRHSHRQLFEHLLHASFLTDLNIFSPVHLLHLHSFQKKFASSSSTLLPTDGVRNHQSYFIVFSNLIAPLSVVYLSKKSVLHMVWSLLQACLLFLRIPVCQQKRVWFSHYSKTWFKRPPTMQTKVVFKLYALPKSARIFFCIICDF